MKAVEYARLGAFSMLEIVCRFVVVPHLRAFFLKCCGATIGKNVRIYEVHLFNLRCGFMNLHVGDNVYVGPGCKIDLEGVVSIGNGCSLAPGVTIITHSDPGSTHNSPLCRFFPKRVAEVTICDNCWIGANSTILCGTTIGEGSVVGACSLIASEVSSGMVYCGVPARKLRILK